MCQRAKKVVSDSPGLVDFTIRLVNSVLNLPNGQVKYFEEFNLQKNCEINEWFSSNVRLSYTHRIMGLPGENIASRYKEMYGLELFLR